MLDKVYLYLLIIFMVIYFGKIIINKSKSYSIIDYLSIFIIFLFLSYNQLKSIIFPLICICFVYKFIGSKMKISKELKISYISLFLIIIYSLLTFYYKENRNIVFSYIYTLLQFSMLVYIVMSFIKDKYDFENLVKLYMYIFIINAIISILEITTGKHMSVSGLQVYYWWNQNWPTSCFFNVNDFGVYLVLSMPMVYFYFYNKLKNKPLLFSIALTIVYSYILFICIIVDAKMLIMVVLLTIIMLIYYYINRKLKLNINSKFIINLFFIESICIFILIIEYRYKLIDRLINDETIKQRLMLWVKAIEISLSNIGGIGFKNFDNYSLINNSIIPRMFGEMPSNFPPHNFFLELIVSCGIISIPFIISFFILMKKLYFYKEDTFERILFLSSVSFFVVSLSSASIVVSTSFFTWYLMIIGYIRYKDLLYNKI